MNRVRGNILRSVSRHIERVLPRQWWRCVPDYRFSRSREWHLGYILEVLLAGALTGCKTLRDVETLSELYAERVPDTTLHDMMIQLDPESLRGVLAKGVKQALRSHELPKSEFPIRLTAIDGKYLYNTRKAVNECSEAIGGGGENKLFRHMTLRAAYVSSATTLCLGQREIKSKGAETVDFIPFVDDLRELYGRTELLDTISVDAGMVSKRNACELRERGLHYIMALKGTQGTLLKNAKELLDNSAPVYSNSEVAQGKEIERTLFRAQAPWVANWEHLTEFWKERKIISHPTSGAVTEEVRYFMTSLPLNTLSHKQALRAIRMHWGIENNANWCLDVHFSEDTAPWTSRAMVLVSLLRMIAFNALSRLKTRKLMALRVRELRWKDLFRYLEHALCQARAVAEQIGTATPAFLK